MVADHTCTLTVGLVCRQGAQTIKAALESVLVQLEPAADHEIIYVDHGSTDGSVELVTNILKNSSFRWQIFSNPENNMALSRQKIVDLSRGSKLLFVDSDVFLPRGWVQKAVLRLDGGEKLAAVSGPGHLAGRVASLNSWELGLRRGMRSLLGNFGSPQASLLLESFDAEHLSCSAVLFRVEALRDGIFDGRFSRAGEDLDRCLDLRRRGWSLRFDPQLCFRHRTASSSWKIWMKRVWKLGRGRGAIARKWPRMLLTYPHLIPLMFLPLLITAFVAGFFWPICWIFLAAYVVAVCFEGVRVGRSSFWRTITAFVLTHVSYSLGQWVGLLKGGSR